MAEVNTEQIVIGALMQNPLLLSQSDKYLLSVSDFDSQLMQHVYYAIANLAEDGSTLIKIQDVDLFLNNTSTGKAVFESQNGLGVLNDAMQLANDKSFNTYYDLLKKENLLRDLKSNGFDTSSYYEINPITKEQIRISDKYAELKASDIIADIKTKLLKVESDYLKEDATATIRASEGIDDIIEGMSELSDIGVPVQGDIYNTIVAGARRGTYYLRSGNSGSSKTRQAVADACLLAYPLRYNSKKCKWEQVGSCEKVLVIATEQDFKEIQKMILAYLSDINEDKFRFNDMNAREQEVLQQAKSVMDFYEDNFLIVRMPSPTIQTVKTIVRENVLIYGVEYVFYDYIFVSPSLLHEFKDFKLRNDEVLLLFSTALKDLAVELDIFVMSSTQLNARADETKGIKGEECLAGARAIANKVDVGGILSLPSYEELEQLRPLIESGNLPEPNIVLDMYKVRAGRYNKVRIWSRVNLGTLKKEDLFVTDARLNPLEDFHIQKFTSDLELYSKNEPYLKVLNNRELLNVS